VNPIESRISHLISVAQEQKLGVPKDRSKRIQLRPISYLFPHSKELRPLFIGRRKMNKKKKTKKSPSPKEGVKKIPVSFPIVSSH
jgi:hypothetical protein